MRKFSVSTILSLSTLLLLSCSLKRTAATPQEQSEISSLSDTVEVDEVGAISAKSNEYTHEMAEANADDAEIKNRLGTSEIDADLPGSEENNVPYARNFLAQKKTKRMQFWVDYFTNKQRERFQRFINNGEEYRHHIEKIFAEHGLPKELYYVGLIESGYYLGARSHAAAVGPWQFIPGTARRYGMKITSELDERQDLFKATHSAARYFKDLHNIFSSWELALSAYNAGENGIIRRIMKHGTRDFYVLSRRKQLPTETINYVPKVLAAMHVIKNASKYGFHIPKKSHHLFDQTKLLAVRKNESINTIARRIGVSSVMLKKLNPELRRSSTPRYFAGTYHLRVPGRNKNYATEELVLANDKIESETVTFTKPETIKELTKRTAKVAVPSVHKVKRGETLISISRKYGVTPRQIASMNGMKSWRTKVRIGQRLKLQAEDAVKSVASAPSLKITNKPIVYKVVRGDNLTDLARMFNSSLSKIKRANNLKRGTIMVGQKIILPGTQKGIYTVKRGDRLNQVARDLKQPVAELIKLNDLKKKSIRIGQKIIVNVD